MVIARASVRQCLDQWLNTIYPRRRARLLSLKSWTRRAQCSTRITVKQPRRVVVVVIKVVRDPSQILMLRQHDDSHHRRELQKQQASIALRGMCETRPV